MIRIQYRLDVYFGAQGTLPGQNQKYRAKAASGIRRCVMMDLQTLQGVITHRYEITACYGELLKASTRTELSRLKKTRTRGADYHWSSLNRVRRWVHRSDDALRPLHRAEIDQDLALASDTSLSRLMSMRRELSRVWKNSSASSEQLLVALQAWCRRAQQSGIDGFEQFALRFHRNTA